MDATIPLSSSDSGKGKTHGTKSDDGRSASPEKVNAKVDSRQIEEAVNPDAVDLNVSHISLDTHSGEDVMNKNCGAVDLHCRPRSESPDAFCSSAHSSTFRSSYAVPENDEQSHDIGQISPSQRLDLAYEVEDSKDEVRSENGGIRSRGRIIRGKGRGNTRPCSGSTTPLTNSPMVSAEKKRSGRGRGSKRGRGFALSRLGEVVESETGNLSLTNVADDVYEFKSSPEGEFISVTPEFGNCEERERSAPPNAKKQRLVETRPESHGGSAHSGDIEMDDIEDDDNNSKLISSDRKVPPLRISLPITHSEEDIIQGEITGQQVLPVHLTSNRKGPRSRHGKRQNEADEAQRMTRSKVRQTGKLLDDTDAWAKKKRCRTNTTQSVVGDEVDEYTTDDISPLVEGIDDTSPTGQASNSTSIPESLSSEQRIIYENPRSGMYHLKKLLAERWIADLRLQKDRRWRDDENYKNMLLLTGNYSSLRLDDNSSADQTLINKAEHKKGQLPVTEVRCSSPAVANGETESEDESNGICGEMKVMWKEHNEERNNMMNRMYKERIKLRLFWEQELLRLEQREKGFTPRMSAVRFLRENEMCNAQILEESTEPLKPMSRNEFSERKNKSINQMFNRHKMEASTLFGLQRDMWWCEARRRGLDVNIKLLRDCVPIVKVEKTDFPY